MEKKYWLHRITGGNNGWEFSHQLLEKEHLLSIGFSDFSENDFVENVREYGITHIDERILSDWGEGTYRTKWNLWRFLLEMKKGDIVIVPLWKSFGVFRIKSDEIITNQSLESHLSQSLNEYCITRDENYLYSNETKNNIDLGFYREVEEVEMSIPRAEYCEACLISRMKIRQTNADISDLKEQIENAIKAYRLNKPINLKNSIVDISEVVVYNEIHRLADSIKLEELVEWYLKSLGANEVIKPAPNALTNDQGDVDREAIFEKLKIRVLVQVKKHENIEANDTAISQVSLYKKNVYSDEPDGYTNIMWVISTCDKYDETVKERAAREGVRLIDGHEFARLILEVGVANMSL